MDPQQFLDDVKDGASGATIIRTNWTSGLIFFIALASSAPLMPGRK